MEIKEAEQIDPQEDLQEDALESEQETEQEETEEAESEESQEETDEKAKPKVEKRINSLVADKKALEETLKARDEELRTQADQIEYLNSELEKAQTSYDKLFPGTSKPLTYDGKELENLSEAQFARAVANIQRLDPQKYDIDQLTDLAINQREHGLKLKNEQQTLTQEENTLLSKYWNEASVALIDPECGGHPGLADFKDPLTKEINDRLNESKTGKFLRSRMVKGGAVFIANYALQVFKELGLDKELQKSAYSKNRPDLKAPVGQTAGKKAVSSDGVKPIFTRAKLQEMLKNPGKVSDKQMAELDKAMAEGRIRD